MNYRLVNLQKLGDSRGSLVALEVGTNVPFDIKRVYYLIETLPEVKRGLHAHKELKQLVIPVRGSCKFLLDDGVERIEITLNDPAVGLTLESLIWREMYDFSEDCVLMVLANMHYDETDYIRNYDEFLMATRKRKNDSPLK